MNISFTFQKTVCNFSSCREKPENINKSMCYTGSGNEIISNIIILGSSL